MRKTAVARHDYCRDWSRVTDCVTETHFRVIVRINNSVPPIGYSKVTRDREITKSRSRSRPPSIEGVSRVTA